MNTKEDLNIIVIIDNIINNLEKEKAQLILLIDELENKS